MIFPNELRIKFKDFVCSRGGLYFKDHDLKNLDDAIVERMKIRGMAAVASYYAFLTTSDERDDEFRELLNLLTINHTYFFRNEAHFEVLKEKVLPVLIEEKTKMALRDGTKPKLRIWSAGCSSGEEPYTIAMVIKEVLGDLDGWEIEILATDASENALRQAQKGLYSKNAVRYVAAPYLQKYFTVKPGEYKQSFYQVSDEIKRMVSFGFFNLMEDDYPFGFDIIFCRNVVIYFELETTIKVMRKFYNALLDEGHLFIGYSESLHFMRDQFQMISSQEAIYYQKKVLGMQKVFSTQQRTSVAEEETLDANSILEEISHQEALAQVAAFAKTSASLRSLEDLLFQSHKHMYLKEYAEALSLLEEAQRLDERAADPLYMQAEIFMNQGKMAEAKESLHKALSLNALFAPAHYLFGCIYFEENMLREAKESLRKALFLDQTFLLAHFYLAQVYRSETQTSEAIRAYRNSLKLLSGYEPTTIIAYSGGFNAATLMSVCRDNLERLKQV